MALPGQAEAGPLLAALDPILHAKDSAVVTRVVAGIRATNAPPTVIGAALYVFSKLVVSNELASGIFRDVVNALVSTGTLPRDVLYEAIDRETHQLIEPGVDHIQEEKRARTRLWFTQTRFNLFREESEGYAKLIALLWECVQSYHEIDQGVVVETVLALTGQFNLDSNRVIELVLSAAAEVIQENISKAGELPHDHRLPSLFARLLDEFARDHVFSVIGAMLQAYHSVPAVAEKPTVDGKKTKDAPSSKATTPVSGDTDKCTAVEEQEARAPRALYALIVVMTREGRVAVSDIWNHMSPRDNSEFATKFVKYEENLDQLKKHVSSSSMSRSSGQDLGMFQRSGKGASERDIFEQYTFVKAGPLVGYWCQKIEFILLLVSMCRWDDAMDAILSMDVDGEHVDVASNPMLSVLLSTIVGTLLNPLLCIRFPDHYRKKGAVIEAIGRLGGRKNRYPCAITSIDELLSTAKDSSGIVVRQMLLVLGPHSYQYPEMLHSLCRLLKGRKEPEAITIMKEVVFPAFSMLQSNLGLADAIWEVIREWPHEDRWELYGYLHNEISSTCAVYQVVASRASYEMRYILKRLTSENYKQHTKPMTKITNGQALPAFSTVLDRIQGYPPDIVTVSPVVDSCRECTELSVDILLYLIVDRMADSRRRRLKEDGINIAQWYSTLCLFLGLTLRKLPVSSQHIEGILSFLYKKLVVDREALLITALSDMIKCVADIEVESNLTAKQLSAQCGGRHLRSVVSGIWGRLLPDPKMVGMAFDPKLEREKKGAMLALLGAFERTEMHVQIALQIARLCKEAVYQEDVRVLPLKLGAHLIDRAKSSLVQLSQFIDTTVPNTSRDEEIRANVWEPLRALGISRMINDMGIGSSAAIALVSPILDYLGDGEAIKSQKEMQLSPNSGRQVTDTKMSKPNTAEREENTVENGIAKPNSEITLGSRGEDVDMLPAEQQDSAGSGRRGINGKVVEKSQSWSQSVLAFAQIVSKRTNGSSSSELVRAFWTLKLDDISVPAELYESEIKRLNMIRVVWLNELDRRRHSHMDRDRQRRNESELRRIRELIDALGKEKKAFEKKRTSVLQFLRANAKQLCMAESVKKEGRADEAVNFFLQECMLPRCKLSISDALFCTKFVFLLLELDIPVLDYSRLFERLLKMIPVVLSSCTENEALSIARLAKEILTTLEMWRSNRETFEREASKKKNHGFRQTDNSGLNPLRHEQYCQWLFEIHESLTQGFCLVLASDEYMHSRNSLCVLAGIADVFPKVSEHSEKIEEQVRKLGTSDLPDIRLSSMGVSARLKSGKAKRLPRKIFMLKPKAAGSGNVSTSEAKPANKKSKPADKVVKTSGRKVVSQPDVAGANVKKSQAKSAKASEPMSGSVSTNPKEVMKASMDLNPNAKEFNPTTSDESKHKQNSVEEKKINAPTAVGKRGREATSETPSRSSVEKSRFDRGPNDSAVQAPPQKKSRNAENRSVIEKERGAINPDKNVPASNETGKGPPAPAADPNRTKGDSTKGDSRNAASGRDVPRSAHERKDRGSADNRAQIPRAENGNRESDKDTGMLSSAREGQIRDVKKEPLSAAGAGTTAHGRRAVSRQDSSSRGAPPQKPSAMDSRSRDVQAVNPISRRSSDPDVPVKEEDKPAGVKQEASLREGKSKDGNMKGNGPRAVNNRDGSSRIGEERTVGTETSTPRDAGSRGGSVDAPRDSGREGYNRNPNRRGVVRRESPGGNMARHGSGRDASGRELNEGVHDQGRRKGSEEPRGRYAPGYQDDPGVPGHTSEYDDAFGNGVGMKRGRDYQSQRNVGYEGEGRRPQRPRTDEHGFRERPGSRDDLRNMHDRRHNGPKTSPRESSRPEAYAGRPRGGFDVHDGRGDGRGNGGRREDDFGPQHNPGWKQRNSDRPIEMKGRDRPGSRAEDVRRDDGRRDDERRDDGRRDEMRRDDGRRDDGRRDDGRRDDGRRDDDYGDRGHRGYMRGNRGGGRDDGPPRDRGGGWRRHHGRQQARRKY